VPSRKRADRRGERNSPHLPNNRLDPLAPKRLRPRRPSPSEFLTASRPSSSHWTDSPEVSARVRRYLAVSPSPLQATCWSALPGRGTHAEPDPSFLQSLPLTEITNPSRGRWLPCSHSRPSRRLLMATRHLAASRMTTPKLPTRTETRVFPFGNPSGDVSSPASPASELCSLRESVPPPRRTGLKADALLDFFPFRDPPSVLDPLTHPGRHRPSSFRPSSALDTTQPASEPDDASCAFLTIRDPKRDGRNRPTRRRVKPARYKTGPASLANRPPKTSTRVASTTTLLLPWP